MNSEMQMQMKRTKREDLRFFMDFERLLSSGNWEESGGLLGVELLKLLTNPYRRENATTVNWWDDYDEDDTN